MKCIYCQGTMERGFSPFHISRKGYHLSLNEVPAWVCGQCGEAYFEEKEVELIQDMIRVIEEHSERMKADSPIQQICGANV